MTEQGRSAWRVTWLHPTGPDECIGGLWDRETAEWMADMLRRSGCRNVKIVRRGF